MRACTSTPPRSSKEINADDDRSERHPATAQRRLPAGGDRDEPLGAERVRDAGASGLAEVDDRVARHQRLLGQPLDLAGPHDRRRAPPDGDVVAEHGDRPSAAEGGMAADLAVTGGVGGARRVGPGGEGAHLLEGPRITAPRDVLPDRATAPGVDALDLVAPAQLPPAPVPPL